MITALFRWCWLVLLMLAAAPAAAQSPAASVALRSFTRGSGSTGLPASTVVSLHTDRQGIVWIATFDGLARVERGFVERTIVGPSASAKDVPVSGPMYRIIDRRDGGVFVTGSKGVYEYDGVRWSFIAVPEELTALAQDASGRLVGLDRRSHIWIKDGARDWVDNAASTALELHALATTDDGRVLAAGGGGAFRIDNGAVEERFGEALPEALTTILVGRDGRVWVGANSGALYSRTGDSMWQKSVVPGWDGGRVRVLAEDRLGRVWSGGDNGRVGMGHAGGTFTLWTPSIGLKPSAVTALTCDRSGAMWFGFNGTGLQQWLGEEWRHRTYWHSPADAEAPMTFSVRGTADGGFIAAVFNHGVWRWNGRTMAEYGRDQGITEDVRFAIEPTPGVIWVGARGGIFEGRHGRFTRVLTLAGGFVSGIFQAPSGDWFAATTADGVFVFRDGRWQPDTALNTELAKFTPNIRDMLWRNGQLWVAAGRQLIVFEHGAGQPARAVDVPEGFSPNALLDVKGALWVGGVGGVVVFEAGVPPALTTAQHVTVEDGLPGATVYALAAAPDGSVWAGGSAGVGHFLNGEWSVFDATNGLISEECNTFGLAVQADGHVLVGTMSGLAVYDPSIVSASVTMPQLFWRTPGMDANHVVSLPASERRIALQWALPWTRPGMAAFRTRVREMNEEWSEPQIAPVYRVENLAAGTYTVDVEARLDRPSAQWSAPITATVVVAPQWWATVWARLAIVAILACVVVVLVRWRTDRLAERAERLEGEMAAAVSSAKVLRGLLPICAHCKKVRDDDGYWTRIEDYITRHSEADFSHGFCPDCVEKHYGEGSN